MNLLIIYRLANVQCIFSFEYNKLVYTPDLRAVQYNMYIYRTCVEYKTVCRLNSKRRGVYANYITVGVVKDGTRAYGGRDVEFPKGRSARELVDRSLNMFLCFNF